MSRQRRERQQKRQKQQARGGRAPWFVAGLLILAIGVGAYMRWGTGTPGSYAATPPPQLEAAVQESGETIARFDLAALNEWVKDNELPAAPQIQAGEPLVMEGLREALEIAATSREASALGRVGQICAALGDEQTARAYFQTAMRLAPAAFRWPYYLGCLSQWNGESEAALDYFAKTLELNPNYPVTHGRIGQLQLEAGRVGVAEQSFARYAELHPNDSLGQVGLARLALERGDAAAALAQLESVADVAPRDFQYEYYMAQTYRALGNRELAQQHFDRSSQMQQGGWFRARDPILEELHQASSSILQLNRELESKVPSGDWAELARICEEIVRRRPSDLGTMGNLISFYRKLRRFEDALAVSERALAVEPRHPRLWNLRGETFLNAGQLEEAIAAAETAIECDSTFARSWATVARVELTRGRYAAAEENIRAFLQLAAVERGSLHYASNLYVLGEAQRLQGNLEQARETYRQVVEMAPQYAPAAERLQGMTEK